MVISSSAQKQQSEAVKRLAASLWLSPVGRASLRQRQSRPFKMLKTHLTFLEHVTWHPSQSKLDVICQPEPLSFWLLSQMNNIGAFTNVLSEFSTGCAGKERHLLWYADCSRRLCCIVDSTANKGVGSVVKLSVPNAPQVNVQSAPFMKSSRISVEQSWALARQCKSPSTLSYEIPY